MEVDDVIAEGDKVVVGATMSDTQRGKRAEITASGRAFSVTTIDIIRFIHGRAVECWGATDSVAMMQQLDGS